MNRTVNMCLWTNLFFHSIRFYLKIMFQNFFHLLQSFLAQVLSKLITFHLNGKNSKTSINVNGWQMDRQSKHKHEKIGEYSNFSSNYCTIETNTLLTISTVSNVK